MSGPRVLAVRPPQEPQQLAEPSTPSVEARAAASAAAKLRSGLASMREQQRFEDESSHFERWIDQHRPHCDPEAP